MTRQVYVSASALATAVGDTRDETFDAICNGKDGFSPVDRFELGRSSTRYAALRQDATVDDLVTRVATGVLDSLGSTSPDRLYLATSSDGPMPAVPRGLGVKGWDRTYTGACVASSTAVIDAANAIASGLATTIAIVAVRRIDARTFMPFSAAGASTSEGVVRPFREGRSGLLLGEGSAIMVISSDPDVGMPIARIDGWGHSGDGYHVCRPEPSGAGMSLAIQHALQRAALSPTDIDYISTHGTATQLNDAAEAAALTTTFAQTLDTILVGAVKSSVGHMLEAAGLAEVILAVESIRKSVAPPNLGGGAAHPAIVDGLIADSPVHQRIDHALSLNLAFGGSNTALLLSSTDADHG